MLDFFFSHRRPWSQACSLSTSLKTLSPTRDQTDFLICCSIFTPYGEQTLGHNIYSQNICGQSKTYDQAPNKSRVAMVPPCLLIFNLETSFFLHPPCLQTDELLLALQPLFSWHFSHLSVLSLSTHKFIVVICFVTHACCLSS